ncbi:MAG: serine hydrolase [Candidatus Doudnabacteria bacterium]|nr:serine hydrolase [Candidatus Doudnabacteria bacterium]
MYRKTIFSIAALGAVVLIFPHQTWNKQLPAVSSASIENQEPSADTVSPELIGGSTAPHSSAKSILAIDLNTGTVLYSQNPAEKLPIASLTKLMTAMVVSDHASKDQVVTIDKADTQVTCLCVGLLAGEQLTVENLLKAMLIPSSNDSAKALARFTGGDEVAFVKMMNDKAAELGLADTHFSNPAGLDSPDNYSTAQDLSKIAQEFLKYSLLERIVATGGMDVSSVDGKFVHHLRTSNKLLLENSEVVGVKTGFTNDAQGNLIIKIDHNGIKVLTIVLNTPNREDDTRNLIDWIFHAYRW